MNKSKLLLTSILLTAAVTPLFAAKKKVVTEEPKDPNEMVAYLFTYFNSNAPEDEQICYAISDDGYNYTPLNMGAPVIESDTIALTQCVRDPTSCAARTARPSTWSLPTCAPHWAGRATEAWCC